MTRSRRMVLRLKQLNQGNRRLGADGDRGDSDTLSARLPSRYIVTILPNRPPHVRRTELEAIIDAMDTLDARVLCCTLKMVECWWRQTGETRSIGADPVGGLPFEQLESTILNGSALADRFLSFGRKRSSG